MLASDINVVHQMAGLQIQAVAGRRIAMGYKDTFARFGDVNVGLDQIAATADVGCHIRRQVSHSGMEYVALAGAVKAVGVHNEALTKAVVERHPEVPRTGGVDVAERTALLARAIVGRNKDDRIREHAGLLKKSDQAGQVPI